MPSDEQHRSQKDLECLLGVGVTVEKGAGQTVVVEGDPRTHGFRVLTGAIRQYKALPDGRRQVLDFLVAGECFALFGADDYAYSVEAIVPSALARYPRANLEAGFRSNPELALRLLQAASTDLEQAQVHMTEEARFRLFDSVTTFLCSFAQRLGAGPCGRVAFRLPMTRQDMADYLGLTIETVSRTLTRLRQEGLITFDSPQDVVLKRPLELEGLAYDPA